MYNGIGLSTPRGSGTNGYVQRNNAFISNFKEQQPYKTATDAKKVDALFFKEPNKEILEHERKRKIEVKCFEMEEEMEEKGYLESEIKKKVAAYRSKLIAEMKLEEKKKRVPNAEPFENTETEHGRLVPHGTHETAALNILKNNVFKEALGIGAEFQDGDSMDLLNQRRKAEKETKTLIEAQQTMQPIESADEESAESEPDTLKRKHKSKKKRKRTHSVNSSDVENDSKSDLEDERRSEKRKKSHKKSHSKKHRHSHSKKKRHD